MTTDLQDYTETTERARFFQTVQAWPLSDDLNYDGWLNNFETGEERKLACLLLDFFTHYSSKMVIQMLNTSVSNSGYTYIKHFSDWKHEHFKTRCIYSFIPGETNNPTDSGHIFTRILRDHMGVPEGRIVNYVDLPEKLVQINKPTPILFVDDFVGSGAQVFNAWHVYKFKGIAKSLSEVCLSGKHCAVYAPIIVNQKGFNVITTTCSGLYLSPTHVLGVEYNLFDKSCICWKGNDDLFHRGTHLILSKSRKLGIPSTGGKDVRDEKGFDNQGLAISFHHGAPDAVPAIFYWSADSWTPLINKTYQR